MGNAARQLTHIDTLEEVPGGCPECGVAFALPQAFIRARRKDCQTFYCPSKHPMSFHTTTADRLRKELEAERLGHELTRRQVTRAREETKIEKRRTAAYKGKVTRIKNRIKNGVCPCCNRSFVNVMRHMKTKHPDFDPNNPD